MFSQQTDAHMETQSEFAIMFAVCMVEALDAHPDRAEVSMYLRRLFERLTNVNQRIKSGETPTLRPGERII